MAAAIYFQRVLRLHQISIFKRGLVCAPSVHSRAKLDSEEWYGSDGAFQTKYGSKLAYRLYCNSTSYLHVYNLQTALSQRENDEDEPCQSNVIPRHWQQRNQYSVSSSRHLYSSTNTMLDLEFNNITEKQKTKSQVSGRRIPPDEWFNSRSFFECRPEYSEMSLNLAQRPSPTSLETCEVLLQKVSVLKESMNTSDISSIIWKLSCVDEEKTALVRRDQRFVTLLIYSVRNLQQFSVCQLLEVLQAFVWLEIPNRKASLLSLYESELIRRVDQMTLRQLLFAADLWRCIGKQVPQFLKRMYRAIPLYMGQIRTPELVQLLYIIGEGRHCPTDLIQPLERLLLQHLRELQPEEVGAVCLGLFKSQTSLLESTVFQIVDKALSFVENMSNAALANVMKYMRFSHLLHKDWFDAMGKEVPKRAPIMGIQGLMHVALASSALHYRNDSMLLGIAERISTLKPVCRIKDSGKLLWAFGTLGFLPDNSPNLYPSLIEELRRHKVEFNRYPQHLLTGLLGLAFVSTFPEDLVAFALNPEFVNMALKSSKEDIKKDFHTLDGAVGLELPNWTGPRLSSELKEEVSDLLRQFAESQLCQKPEIVEAEMCLKELLGGEEFVCKRLILPHTRSIDLEVHLDSKGQPIPVMPPCNIIPEKASTKSQTLYGGKMNIGVSLTDDLMTLMVNTKRIKPTTKVENSSIHRLEPYEGEKTFDTSLVLSNEVKEILNRRLRKKNNGPVKLAIQVCHRNHYCNNTDQLIGFHAMKRRHLKLAGYKVIELLGQEWFPMLRKSRTEKLEYLHRKVFDQ